MGLEGKILLLGSASLDMWARSDERLSERIAYIEMISFSLLQVMLT